MKCKECFKELNEMTAFCDRCGAQLTEERMELSFKIIQENIIPLEIETTYTKDHQEEIKNAYFLSNIRNDFRGGKRKYIDQYIDYVLLRTYYEKNKRLLTTGEFEKKKALSILNAFINRRPDNVIYEILKEEYGDDYDNRVIPKGITNNVEKVYLSEYNLKKLNPSKFFSKAVTNILISTIKSLVFFGVIGGALYFVMPMVITDFDLVEYILSNQYIVFALAGVILIRGLVKSHKNRKYYPFEDIINSNEGLKRRIKMDIKKRAKTLEYRIKKEKG